MQQGPALSCVAAVFKVASRCNLNCAYCYVYNKGDDGWRRQPPVMARQTAITAINRLSEHCRAHAIDHFEVIFHGGEPLLAGPEFFEVFVREATARMAPETRITFTVQTNGISLTRDWARCFRRLGVKIGISIDGTARSHDRMRVDHKGRGSYSRVVRGLDAARSEGLSPGILAVVDLAEDPIAVFEHLASLKPRLVDFLLPLATWDSPPERSSRTAYADWLITIFELWLAAPVLPFRIRLFEQIVRTVLGFPRNYDALGPGVNRTVVIETDGAIESVDVLRVCENGMTSRGYHVSEDSIDTALDDPLAQAYLFAADRLCGTCQACRVRDICAGGYLPHRFRRSNGFDNPSVYCADLLKLISTVQDWAVRQVPADLRNDLDLRSLAPSPVGQEA